MKYYIYNKLQKSRLFDIKLSVTLKNLGQSFYGVFEPIIFYKILGERVEYVLLYYGLQSLLYALLVNQGAKIMSRIGIKKSLIIGTLLLMLYNIFLIYFLGCGINLDNYKNILILGFFITALNCSLYQTFYWPAFHTDLSLFLKEGSSGKNLGVLFFIGQCASIVGPVIGGIILQNSNLNILFFLQIIFLTLSVVPLFFGPDEKPETSYKFKDYIKELFNIKKIKNYLPFFAEGIKGYINSTFWGLFIYTVLESVIDVGLLTAGVSFFTALFVVLLGKIIDKRRFLKNKLLGIGVFIASFGWIIKGVSINNIFYFIADNVQKFGDSIVQIPYQKTMYKRFKNVRSLADEYVTIREMAYHIGGGVIIILLALIIYSTNLSYSAFIVAAFSYVIMLAIK